MLRKKEAEFCAEYYSAYAPFLIFSALKTQNALINFHIIVYSLCNICPKHFHRTKQKLAIQKPKRKQMV